MKITKQRLKEIIKEELETVSVGAGIEDFPEPEEVDDPDLGLGTPEETLLTLMRAREILDRFESFEELAEAFPEISHDEALARWVAAIKENPMYGSSGMEESKVSGHRSEVTYSKSKRGQSKKPEKKAYNKAERAQSKRDIKKEKDR